MNHLFSAKKSSLHKVLENTLNEVNADGTYASLKHSVAKSKKRSEEKKKISESEKAIRDRIVQLKAAIAEANRSAEEDIRVQDLKIASLKDGLLVRRSFRPTPRGWTKTLSFRSRGAPRGARRSTCGVSRP